MLFKYKDGNRLKDITLKYKNIVYLLKKDRNNDKRYFNGHIIVLFFKNQQSDIFTILVDYLPDLYIKNRRNTVKCLIRSLCKNQFILRYV